MTIRWFVLIISIGWLLGCRTEQPVAVIPTPLSTECLPAVDPAAEVDGAQLEQAVIDMLEHCQPPQWPRSSVCVGMPTAAARPSEQYNQRLIDWVAQTISDNGLDVAASQAALDRFSQSVDLFHNGDSALLATVPLFRCGSGAYHYHKWAHVVVEQDGTYWEIGRTSPTPAAFIVWQDNRWLLFAHDEHPHFSGEKSYTIQEVTFDGVGWRMDELFVFPYRLDSPTVTHTAAGVQFAGNAFEFGATAPCPLQPVYQADTIKYQAIHTVTVSADTVTEAVANQQIEFWRDGEQTDAGSDWQSFCEPATVQPMVTPTPLSTLIPTPTPSPTSP